MMYIRRLCSISCSSDQHISEPEMVQASQWRLWRCLWRRLGQ